MKRTTKKRMKFVVISAATFMCGLLVGVSLMVMLGNHLIQRFLQTRQVAAYHKLMARGIDQRLDLNDEERAHITRVLQAHEPPHEAVLREKEIKMIPIRRAAFKEIRQHLRPKNQRELDRQLDELETKRFERYTNPIDKNNFPKDTPK